MRKAKVWVLSAIAIIALVSIRDKEIVLNVPSGQALTAEAYHSAQAATSSTSLTPAASTATLTTNQSTSIPAPTGTGSSSGSTGGSAVTEDASDSGATSTSQSNGSTSSQSSGTQPESSSTTTAANASTTSAASTSTDSVVYYGLTSTSETNDEEDEDELGATNATNNAPVVSSYVPSASSASVTAGSSVSFSINATDADGDALSYAWLFDGASLTNTANSWAYSPLAADVGSHTVGVVVSDGSLTAGMTWTVTVTAAATGAIHINSLLPDSATKGVNVVIQGGGFSETASENIVKFGSVQASSVGVVSSNQIRATVPDGISAGFKDLTVSVGSDTSNSAMFNYLADSSSAVFVNQTSSLIPAGMTLNDSSIIRLADIDGDNDIDLLIVDTTSGKLYILTNNAGGVFTNETSARIPSSVYSNATHITDVKFGDINNDGYPEIVIAYSAAEGQSVRLLINSGTGTFTDMTSADLPALTGDASALDIGDANGDGYADIVVASRDSSDALLINNSSGVFTRDTAFALPVVIDGSSDIRFCDVNNDGALDIITTNNEIISVSELRNRIYVNNGSGIFTDATETLLPADSDYSEVLDVGDINNDGNIDLVVADYTQNLIFMNTGSGFEDKTSTLIGANYFHSNCIKLGDMNGDGYQDIVVIGDDGSSLLLNDKAGSFAANDASIKLPNYSGIPAAVGGNSVQLADVNGDGTLDIIVGGASLYILTSSVTDKAPVLDAIGDKSVEAGKTLSFSVNASDPNGDAITYTAANLPGGATFNATSKLFSWTPDTAAVGDYANIAFTATENTADALADSENIKISVISGLPVIDYYIPDTTDISATIGNVVQFGISAHDPKGGAITYTWYFNGEVIPNITDSSSSNIFIFPKLGDNTISIKVANSTGSVSVSWDLTVTDTNNEVPEITAYSPASSSISVNLSNESLPDFSVTAIDAEGDPLTYCWRIDGQTVSNAATLTSAQYSTLATVGSHIVMAYVSDGVNTAVAKAWTLGVTQAVNSAPVISSYSPIEAEKTIDLTVGGFINFAISASDPEGVALVYTWEFDNNIVSTTSSLVASAYSASATIGDHLVKVSISDGYNTPVSRQWVIHIIKTNQAPVIASYSPSSSSVNVDLATETLPDFSITVTDRENDTLAYSWTIDGAAVSSTSSLLKSAYASTATVGTHTIVASVSDGTNAAVTQTWTIHVIKTNQAPVIASYSPSSSSVNVDLATETLPDFSITVTDRENDTLAYSWTIDGAAVSSTSSLLKSAYASTATVGTHTIVASVSDGTNTAVTKTWTLVVTQTVNSAPVISSYSPTLSEMTVDLTVGGSANFSVVATDADNDTLSYAWTFDGSALSSSSSALASSAYLAAAGIGDHIVKASVSDGTNAAVTQTWTIHVIKTNQAPVIASYSPSSSSVNVDLATETLPDFSITVTDRENDTLAYSWTIDGAAVSSTSSLLKSAYASTATVGTHTIVASVSDGTNTAVTKTWALVVTDSTVVINNPPVIASYVPATTAVSATVSAGTVNFSVAANDADGDNLTYKWTVDGAATSNTTSNYVFTVLSAGTHVVTASVTDNKIASTEEPVTTWNVTIVEDPVNNSPEITAHTPSGSSFSMTSGNSQVFSVTATDLDSADTLTYAWTVDGVTVGINSNSYTYAPSTEGAYAIKVTVTDGKIATPVYQAWTVTVGARDVLSDVSAHAFKYFWNEADATTGLVRDRLLATSSTPSDDMYYDRSSVAATGFGLAALTVAAENYSTAADSEWTVTPEAIADRVEATLDTLLLMQASQSASGDATWGKDGFLYHFVNMSTGTRFSVESEVSTIDTALAVAGALTAGEYFKTIRPAILTKANQLYANVNWKAFLDTTAGTNYNRLYKAWLPDGTGFGSCGHWDYTDESLLLYLLAIGSPATSHAIDPDCYYAPTKDMGNYSASGKPIVMSWFGSLFTYQFAQSFFDFRGMHDARGVNWWQNSIDATIANRQFCLDNSADYNYGEYVWGLSSEYGSGATYLGDIGAKPLANASGVSHCGFVNPLAVAASIGMLPDEVTATLKSMTEDTDLWLEDSYGFVDSFKGGSTKLYSDYFVGIDLGAAVLMLSNYNDSSLVWNKFMGATTRYGDMRDLLTTLGFKSDTDTARYVDVDDITAKSQFMYGYVDSSNPTAQIKVNLSEVASDKDYLLAIHTFMNNYAGDHSVVTALTINGTAYGSRTFTHVTDVDDSIAYIEVPGSLLNVGENTIAFTWVSGASWLACKNIEFTSPVTTNEWTVVRSEYASEYRVDDTYYATHADSSKYGAEAYKTFAQALNISTKPYTDILFYADDLTHNRTLTLSQMYADGTVYVDVLVNDQAVASNIAFGDSQQVTIPAGVMNNGWNRITLKIVSGGGEWIVWNTISCATGGLASTAVPKDLVAASYGTDKINLRWSAVSGTNVRYNIYRGTSAGGSYTKINSSALTSPVYQDSGLTGSMTYYYVVTAFEETNPTAETAYSTEASKTTGAYDLDYGDGTDPNAFGGTSGSQFTYLSMIKHDWLTGYARKLLLPAGDTATISLNGADVSQAGVLSLWINSVSGGEKIKIGLSSSSSSVSSVAVTAAAGWQNVKIKLSEFSGLSSNSLSALYVISDSTSAATLYLDDIQFIKSTTSSATLEVSVKNVSDNSRSSGISFTTSSGNDYAPANQYLEVTCASDSAKNWKVWIYTNNTNGNSTAMNGYYNGLMRSDGKARLPLLWRVYPAVQPSGIACATSSDVYSGSTLTWNYLLDKNDTNWASSNTTGAEYSVVCYGKYNEWAWLSQVPPGSGNRGTVNDKMYIYLGSILAGASAGNYSAAIYLDITHE